MATLAACDFGFLTGQSHTMGRKKRWVQKSLGDGVWLVELSSWRYFLDYFYHDQFHVEAFIWRGQQKASWLLRSTLDRHLEQHPLIHHANFQRLHLAEFKYAARGRRGSSPREIKDENEWWALGQHYGLRTPLLDWAASPFVAAYFAYLEADPKQLEQRAVFALNRFEVESKSTRVAQEYRGADRPSIIELVRPLTDENPRLVSQSGLFTRGPDGVDVESWVRGHFGGSSRRVLLKFTLPNQDRTVAVESLNEMNINHLSLFPDLNGASRYCNLRLERFDS